MVLRQVRMRQRLFRRNAPGRIKCKHLLEQVECLGRGMRIQARERHLGHLWELSNVVLGTLRTDAGNFLVRGRSQNTENEVQLVDVYSRQEVSERISAILGLTYSPCQEREPCLPEAQQRCIQRTRHQLAGGFMNTWDEMKP